VTVKVRALLVPAGVVTVTFLAPPDAPEEITRVAVTVVSFTTSMPVKLTPPPDTAIAVVPVRPVPVSVTAVGAPPRSAEAGVIDVSTGPVTVNVALLLDPPEVTTYKCTAPKVAEAVLLMVAVIIVLLSKVTPLTLTPLAGAVMATVLPVVKLVPVRVTGTLAPRRPELGVIDVSAGTDGATTVKVAALVVPAGVVTVTLRAESVAVGAMVRVAVTVVAATAVTALTVMPVPVTFTAVSPVRRVPVIVTATTVPCAPVAGEIAVSVPTPLPWNSMAPMSNRFGVAGSGLGLPK
jgi:hypothetical protein